jgi:hypothetical protein
MKTVAVELKRRVRHGELGKHEEVKSLGMKRWCGR